MSVSIRCPDSAASRQLVTLENVPYNVLLTWNERAQGWTFGMEDRDGTPILLGRRVVLQLDLISGFHHLTGVPTGGIFAMDKTKSLRSILREDLIQARAIIYYLTRAEIDAL